MPTLPTTTRAIRLGAALCLAVGFALAGCDEGSLPIDTGIPEWDIEEQDTGLDATISTLTDNDGASMVGSLEVEQIEVTMGVDALLDWSGLTQDLWGRPLDPLTEAQRASLYHFNIDDLDAVLDGLLHGSLYQSVLDLQVTCASETASCHMSEFSFMLGHAVDVVEVFGKSDGLWLLAIQSNDGAEDLAYLVLVPVEAGGSDTALVHDGSSSGHLDADMGALPVVTVEPDGVMRVDWSGLTTDCLGDTMDPRLIDSLKLARVPEEKLADPLEVVMHLHEVAEELWVAQVPNSESSFPLAEMHNAETGAKGFQGPDGPDAWLLILECSTCGDALPRFLTRLAWADEP
ncbi:MAG: hypothetical protein ABIO70_00250 [Pseudomonadota bacterium]